MGRGFREKGLFFGDVGVGGVDGPCFGFGVKVGIVTSEFTKNLPRLFRVVVFGKPFGGFGDGEESEELCDADKACGGEDETPGEVMAEEVAEELGGEDPDVDHHLGEGSEKTLFGRRGHFGDVDGDNHEGCSGA